jgi:hypothetical protein
MPILRCVLLFEDACHELAPHLQLLAQLPLLLNWLSELYYCMDMPDELYLLRLWVISLFAFLVLGDASLLFLDMNCLRLFMLLLLSIV